MRVVIVEDEQIAFEKLKALLARVNSEIEVVGHAKSVEHGIELMKQEKDLDLAFFDIQLEDGLSFSILEEEVPDCPIIFTTAYDDYAIRAFDHHSIAYILKPIQKSDLEKALEKYKALQPQVGFSDSLINALQKVRQTNFKERFTVKIGDKIKLFTTDEIYCFFSRNKGSYLCANEGKHYLIDYPLDTLESMIDGGKFFRVNRKHIVRIDAIERVVQYTNSRLKLELNIPFDEEIIVAREKVKSFKLWLEGEVY